jgi:hypothetical protein
LAEVFLISGLAAWQDRHCVLSHPHSAGAPAADTDSAMDLLRRQLAKLKANGGPQEPIEPPSPEAFAECVETLRKQIDEIKGANGKL